MNPLPDREELLDEVITDYLRACESGVRADPGEWVARHPEIADELRAFFAQQARVERLAAPLRPAAAAEATLGPGEARDAGPGVLRYFGDYEVLEEIARGGMGVVYRA